MCLVGCGTCVCLVFRVCVYTRLHIYKKRGPCHCLFRLLRPSHCPIGRNKQHETHADMYTPHTSAFRTGYKPVCAQMYEARWYTSRGHPSLQCFESDFWKLRSFEIPKQSVIRRLYKICSQAHLWRRHPVADYAVRTSLRGLCNCKDTSKILNTQTNPALFETRRAIICENGIFCVPLQAKRD